MKGIDRGNLERVARLYNQNKDASRALGITPHHFARLCRSHGTETPHARHRRDLDEVIHGA